MSLLEVALFSGLKELDLGDDAALGEQLLRLEVEA